MVFDAPSQVHDRRVLRPAAELEVRFLEGAIHRIGSHLLEEVTGEHDFSDARCRLPPAGGQLGIEVGELRSKAGFPHALQSSAREWRATFFGFEASERVQDLPQDRPSGSRPEV